jgi:hypothetical protein
VRKSGWLLGANQRSRNATGNRSNGGLRLALRVGGKEGWWLHGNECAETGEVREEKGEWPGQRAISRAALSGYEDAMRDCGGADRLNNKAQGGDIDVLGGGERRAERGEDGQTGPA